MLRTRGRFIPWAPAALFALAILGVSILMWLSPVPSEAYTPAQERLLDIADWMVKASVGALLGFAGGRAATRYATSSSD